MESRLRTSPRPVSSIALALAVAFAAAITADAARADCVRTTSGFRCVGVDPDGVAATGDGILGQVTPGARVEGGRSVLVGDRATILVAEGAEVDGDYTGIKGGRDLTILNDGNIGRGHFTFSIGGTAVEAGDDTTVVNGRTGTISADGTLLTAGDGLTFTNAGAVSALYRTIVAEDDATVINTGRFFGQERFIVADDDLSVVNTGEMRGYNEGIRADGGLTLTNSGTMRSNVVVDAGDDATVSNSGSIRGDTFGVQVGSWGSLWNDASGVVRGGERAVIAAGGLEVENDGAIQGGAAAAGRVRVLNGPTGTIEGDVLSSGASIEFINEGLVDGSIDALNAVTVTNDGTILSTIDGAYEGARVTNTGTIRADGNALRSGSFGVELTNEGVVEAGLDALSGVFSATADNAGVITAGDDGLDGAFTTLKNTGVLTAADDGVVGSFAVSVENSGRIVAGDVGILGGGLDGPKVVNTGWIEAGGDGLRLLGVSEVVNGAGGVIRGGSGTAVALDREDDAVTGEAGSLFDGDLVLGAGDDRLTLAAGAGLTGEAFLGVGDDRFVYERSMLEVVTDAFGLFAGGPGFDVASFAGFGLGDLEATPVAGGFDLLLEDGPSRVSARLTGFERVRLDDVVLSFPAALAPVPLPAGLPLLAAALSGLAALRRRGLAPNSCERTRAAG